MPIDVELLINEVQGYEELYDPDHRLYIDFR